MVSLRFPFSFSQPQKPAISGRARDRAHGRSGSFSAATVACSAVAAAAGAAVAISQNPNHPFVQNALNFWLSNFSPNSNRFSPVWGSLSLAADQSPVTEPKTGVSFPAVLGDSQRLLGIGLRKKSVLGLKNIDVYAFGVYADDDDIKKTLGKKYGEVSVSELEEKKKLINDLMESDVCTTVRLQIVYGKLSIRSVRSAFEESVGSRLQKFGGSDNKELLVRFTSQFKDEYKIPRGSIIDLSRESGYVLQTRIDGKEVGSIKSKLLCRSLLDLYLGDDPFDRPAKEDIEHKLVSVIQKNFHDVLRVTHKNFNSCNATAPYFTLNSGNDSFTVKRAGHFYFICSVPGHCEAGQKVDIRVPRAFPPSPSPSPTPAPRHPPHSPSPSLSPLPSPSPSPVAPGPSKSAASLPLLEGLLYSKLLAAMVLAAVYVSGFAH